MEKRRILPKRQVFTSPQTVAFCLKRGFLYQISLSGFAGITSLSDEPSSPDPLNLTVVSHLQYFLKNFLDFLVNILPLNPSPKSHVVYKILLQYLKNSQHKYFIRNISERYIIYGEDKFIVTKYHDISKKLMCDAMIYHKSNMIFCDISTIYRKIEQILYYQLQKSVREKNQSMFANDFKNFKFSIMQISDFKKRLLSLRFLKS